MKCIDCEHFHIRMDPWKSGGVCWDMGLAECRKHNMVVDYLDKRKLNKLACVEVAEHDSKEFCFTNKKC